jgi:hypothetical protein
MRLKNPRTWQLSEMKVLLKGGDEVANFFNNVLHVSIDGQGRLED